MPWLVYRSGNIKAHPDTGIPGDNLADAVGRHINRFHCCNEYAFPCFQYMAFCFTGILIHPYDFFYPQVISGIMKIFRITVFQYIRLC